MHMTMGPAPVTAPAIKRENLALRLRQNWLAKHPIDAPPPTVALDDSLTSLNWLQNLNIMKITTPTPPASPQPQEAVLSINNSRPMALPAHSYPSNMQVNPNAVLNMTNLPRIKSEPGLVTSVSVCPQQLMCGTPLSGLGHQHHYEGVSPPALTSPHSPSIDKIDYKTNPHVKPPYSYATLICMAMRESKKNKITLAGIYTWITENFMYYRVADPSWQNSIRHNLSLNKCFQKVPRRKDEPGKGGFWRINPEYQDMFVNGIFKKRRCPAGPSPTMDTLMPPTKRVKKEQDDSNGVTCNVIGTVELDNSESCPTPSPITSRPINRSDAMLTISNDISEALDFSWSAILHQDIEVSGVKVKTEDIIDEKDEIASPITALSPPPSESSSDVSLEDLLNAADLATGIHNPAMDMSSGSPLDLTVQGMCIKAPTWWDDSFGGDSLRGILAPQNENRSGLSTPINPSSSPSHDVDFSHPWAEDKSDIDQALASFDSDLSNLFDIENLHSPSVDS